MEDVLAVVGPGGARWRERLQQSRPGLTVLFFEEAPPLEQPIDPRITILAASGGHSTAQLCARLPHLRWLQTFSAGIDAVVHDVPNRVLITTVKGLSQEAVAEHAMALLLHLTRIAPNLPTTPRDQQVPLDTLAGKTHLIVGYGHIGRQIGLFSEAFGMKVRAVRYHPASGEWGLDAIDDLLGSADVVTLACPLTEQTRHLINRKRLQRMRSKCLLINIARAEVVNQDDLCEALRLGEIGGAGLDVTVPEPLPAGHPLLQMHNVVVTPHVAGNVPDYLDRAMAILVENLQRDYAAQPLINVVARADGY